MLLLLMLILWNVRTSILTVRDTSSDPFRFSREMLHYFESGCNRQEVNETNVLIRRPYQEYRTLSRCRYQVSESNEPRTILT